MINFANIFPSFLIAVQAQRLVPPYSPTISLATLASAVLKAGWDSTIKNLWITLVANWYVWPGTDIFSYFDDFLLLTKIIVNYLILVINFVNFLYVPISYRFIFHSTFILNSIYVFL